MKLSAIMDVLLAALVVELRADGATEEELCAVAVYPGDAVPLDSGCGITAWVRLVEANPSTGFPTVGFPSPAVASKACFWTLIYNVEMGVVRPSPIPEEILSSIDMPGDEEHTASAHKQFDDMEAMDRAVRAAKREIDELTPVNYTPIGPDGGVVGGTWSMQVGNG